MDVDDRAGDAVEELLRTEACRTTEGIASLEDVPFHDLHSIREAWESYST